MLCQVCILQALSKGVARIETSPVYVASRVEQSSFMTASKSFGNGTTLPSVSSLYCQIPSQLEPFILTNAWCAAGQRKMRASGRANAHQVPELTKLHGCCFHCMASTLHWYVLFITGTAASKCLLQTIHQLPAGCQPLV